MDLMLKPEVKASDEDWHETPKDELPGLKEFVLFSVGVTDIADVSVGSSCSGGAQD